MPRSRRRKTPYIPPAARAALLAAVLAAAAVCIYFAAGSRLRESGPDIPAASQAADPGAGGNSGTVQEDAGHTPKVTAVPIEPVFVIPAGDPGDNPPNKNGWTENFREKQIYSYVQVPDEIYDGDLKWSGDWGNITAAGREFIYWGCGICCLSNIFSTYRGKPVPPDEVFDHTVSNTDYNPYSGVGAVSWAQLKKVCGQYGFQAVLKSKPADYSVFQKDMREAAAVIVLVSKQNDAKLWWYTNGHYVNLWEYDPVSDSVFLSDPSGLFNRARVMLIDIYKALKTSSDAQYLIVEAP